MTVFAHASVLLGIILGVAMAHVLGGISLMLDARVRTRVDLVHLLWTANMLLVPALFWMNSFVVAQVDLGVVHFLNLIAYSMIIYVMAGLLFPERGDEVTDFRLHFEANRTRFYWVVLMLFAVDLFDAYLEHTMASVPWDVGQLVQVGICLVLLAACLASRQRWLDILLAAVFHVGLWGWLYSLVDYGVLSS